jgi:hypothetical protein
MQFSFVGRDDPSVGRGIFAMGKGGAQTFARELTKPKGVKSVKSVKSVKRVKSATN